MSNAVAPVQSTSKILASQFNMGEKEFLDTLKKIIVPHNITDTQMAVFLSVANQYNLNPLTKEIYAFPGKGGIHPIVSVDGWIKLCNLHPSFNGMKFEENFQDNQIFSITCHIFRNDRQNPTVVTEYFSECSRDTEPWKKSPVRMLRHKALIQCARVAFGFSGIMDEDEFMKAGMKDVSPKANGIDKMRQVVAETSAPLGGEIIEASEPPQDEFSEKREIALLLKDNGFSFKGLTDKQNEQAIIDFKSGEKSFGDGMIATDFLTDGKLNVSQAFMIGFKVAENKVGAYE